jgi:hypothetical protein
MKRATGNHTWYFLALAAGASVLVLAGCDRRGSVNRFKPEPTFTTDITVVRDFVERVSRAEITFFRDGEPIENGAVRLNNMTLSDDGEGAYFITAVPQGIPGGANTITFESSDDEYTKTISLDMPDSFGVTTVNPRDNSGLVDVTVEWSRPGDASLVLLVVVAREYPFNGTSPFIVVQNADANIAIVPDTTFEDSDGLPVDDTYYIYLAAFNEGFGEYEGIPFPLPPGLPQRRILDPSGFARYGTVAPVDSIVVRP